MFVDKTNHSTIFFQNKLNISSQIFSISETRAEISGPSNKFLKAGSTLQLSCRVFLGPEGPDEDYKKNAVVHWFHDHRLLDPELESWKRKRPRLTTGFSFDAHSLQGWLQVGYLGEFISSPV